MSLTLADIKQHLRVSHTADDARLTLLLRSATEEALRFMGLPALPTQPDDGDGSSSSSSSSSTSTSSEDDGVMPDVLNAIVLLVRADYDGDPAKREDYQRGAEALLRPYRERLGCA
jgi:Phage gp6-like head-tail connector protein